MKKTIIVLVAGVLFLTVSGMSRGSGLLQQRDVLFRKVQVFADAITLISTEYVKHIEIKELVHGAIRGMMAQLDGYSQFLDEEGFKRITVETKGEFGGIGIRIGVRDGVLTVIAPIEGTPAAKAGLEAGDKMVKIEGRITRDLSLDDAVELLRGEPNTEVDITVVREEEVLDFTIKRAIIKVESIREKTIIDGDIGYIKLVEFQRPTSRDFREVITMFQEKGAKSVILDLRNNPGGLLDAAVDTADLILEKDQIVVYTEGRDPTHRTDYISKNDPVLGDLKLVVLVNEGSASAAEILAGAVKDNRAGLVIGQATFGKGSVQTVIPLKDGSALRLSTAAYYTPAGHNLMDKGVEPDIFVEQLPLEKKREEKLETDKRVEELFRRLAPREQLELKEDPEDKDPEEREVPFWKNDNQLLTAVNILRGMEVFSQKQFSEDDRKE